MKKSKLLGLVALASLGLNANAQVTLPDGGGTYYVYNKEAKAFLTRGSNWGTRGYVNDVALPFTITKVGEGTYKFEPCDFAKNNLNKGLTENTYVDSSNPTAWSVSGDIEGYTIGNGERFFSAPGNRKNLVFSAEVGHWQFFTQEQYDAKLAALAETQNIAAAKAAGVSIPDGTTLDAALSNFNEGLRVSPEPKSSNYARIENWTKAALGSVEVSGQDNRGTTMGNVAVGVESYQAGGVITRQIEGLTPGLYKVYVKGSLRATSNANCVAFENEGIYPSDAYAVVNGNIIPIKAWARDNSSDGEPNSPAVVAQLAENGKYTTSSLVYVGDDGILSMEVNASAWWNGMARWFMFLGIDYAPYTDNVSAADVQTLINSIPSETVYSVYRQELNAAQAALELEASSTNYKRLKAAIEVAEANVSQYQNLAEAISTFSAYTAVSPDAKSALSAAIQTAQGVYDNASVENTSATIAALEAAANNANVTDYSYVKATYPDAVVLGDWTTNNFGTTSGQGYKDNSQGYYDKWNASAFNLNLAQDIELPAGEYVLYGIGRGQAKLSNVELFVSYGQTENVAPFRMKGDLGLGVDVDGVANFSADATYNNAPNGRGWEYRYIAFELAEPTTITVGARGSVGTNGASWAGVFAPVLVGKPNLSLALNNLNNAIAEAEKVNTDAKLNAAVKQTFTQALATANTAKSSTDKTTIDNATAALESATNAANSSIAVYEQIAVINAKAATLDAVGQASYASTLAAYNDGTLTTVAEAETVLVTAVKAQTTVGADMTLAIANPSFENDFTGWVNTGLVIQNNNENVKVGSKYAEIWQPNGTFDVHQTITLPKGYYTVTIREKDRNLPVAAILYANEETVDFYGKNEADELSINFYVDSEQEVTIGASCKGTGVSASWFAIDNFRLTYNGADKPAPVIADLIVNDGVAVEASQDAKNITYVREFKAANKWQSLYLPFSVNLENNEADVVLAKVDDVVENNGELVINIVKVSATETVEACNPLFIAAKTVGVKNIKTGVSTVESPNDRGNVYSAAEFTGILSEASAGKAGKYVMSGGELCLVPQSMNNLTLGVNRWAMTVNGGNGVRIRINAEGFNSDEATAIASAVAEYVENGEIFSINGAKVKDAKSGLYIKGGKKVYVK
ncbi:MAG: hypothetical protein J6Y15_07820 [Bacteroidaceae bacterium]|nr:hypothetical protein [Bacteroidaceae bacterium]